MNKQNIHKIQHLLFYAFLSMALAACGSTVPPRFYTLSHMPQQMPAQTSSNYKPIDVRPVKVPERLKRPQIVLNSATSPQLILLENERWSAMFDDELHDAINSELNHLLAPTQQSYRVSVTLQQLQVIKGQAVKASFSWQVQNLSNSATKAQPDSSLCQFATQQEIGNSVEAAVQGMQKVVDLLSGEIAQHINSLDAGSKQACT
jgi:uncharacterized protein